MDAKMALDAQFLEKGVEEVWAAAVKHGISGHGKKLGIRHFS